MPLKSGSSQKTVRVMSDSELLDALGSYIKRKGVGSAITMTWGDHYRTLPKGVIVNPTVGPAVSGEDVRKALERFLKA
jgi:hypothetical protein